MIFPYTTYRGPFAFNIGEIDQNTNITIVQIEQ